MEFFKNNDTDRSEKTGYFEQLNSFIIIKNRNIKKRQCNNIKDKR